MPICASGEISLGGSTVGRSVNIEIGAGNTATITMNQANVRALAGVSTVDSQISMNCFYGRTRPPTTLGCVFEGGYYTGVIDIGGGVCYYMIVSPNATGCASCQWKTDNNTTTGTSSYENGYSNTWGPMNNATHPAGNFTATRSINGYSDWYLPAVNETGIMYTNKGSMPAGQGYTGDRYWASTEWNVFTAWIRGFFYGNGYSRLKTYVYRIRALRRSRL